MRARSARGSAGDGEREAILRILRGVRGRWRLRLLMAGVAWTLAAGVVAFLVSGWGLQLARFDPTAVTLLRFTAWTLVAAVAAWTLVRPLLRRVDDERVALYLEEHEPSLEAAILGAVQVGRDAGAASPELVRGLVREAVVRAREVEEGRRIERQGLYRSSGLLAGVAVATLLILLLVPSAVRHGISALLVPTTDAASVTPYAVMVSPGDATVARGSDQRISATLKGFSSQEVTLFTRSGEDDAFGRLSMLPVDPEGGVFADADSAAAGPGGFELLLLDLQDGTDYFVEADGVRSPTYHIAVADLPYVGQLEQELRFPSWTGLPPKEVEDGGDVAAVRGTEVRLRVHPTLPTSGGRIVMDGGRTEPLAAGSDGTLTGSFDVRAPGFFRVELKGPDGTFVEASPAWSVDVLQDQPPTVSFTKPGRDQPASPIEEVYLEAQALDDYGVDRLLLVTSVNGGAPDTVSLFGGAPLKEVSAGHTLYLEELGLKPGDVVSYYAVAEDRGAGAPQVTSSDLYFLEIRPFGRDYHQSDQQGGGAGMGGGGQTPEVALSELQKQVVAATFNLQRDAARYDSTEFSQGVGTVGQAQAEVRQQVETLVQRMGNRGLSGAEERFRQIADLLPKAAEEMKAAEKALGDKDLQGALGPEQQALQHLRTAEEMYDRYVSQQQGGGGGGGGAQGANADDLADLFELELDKLQNQYETVQRGQQQQTDAGVDEVLERLKELARRQQQELERRRRAAAQPGASGGGGASQRALADSTEALARQLEKLARDSGDQQLQQQARDLQQTADAMRKAAAASGSTGQAQADAAAQRLADAQRRLEGKVSDRVQRDAQDAAQRARRLTEQQRDMQGEVRTLPELIDPTERARKLQDLQQRKQAMADEVSSLEQELDAVAAEARREGQGEVAQKAADAAEAIRQRKIKEKIQFSRGVIQQRGSDAYAQRFEAEIGTDLQALDEAARAAADAVDDAGPNPLEDALDRTRELSRGAQSLERRLQDRGGEPADSADADRQGAAGQRGRQQSGQQGQQQSGQQGQQQGGQQGQQQGGQQGQPQSGQPGQQQGSQQGQQPGDRRLGGGRGGDGRFSPDDLRQLRREFQQRAADARALRDDLRRQGQDVSDLDRVIRGFEGIAEMADKRPDLDMDQVRRIQAAIREGLERTEFRLRRQVEGDASQRGVLQGTDDVPEGFRKMVEEYFRTLSKEGGGG